MRLTRTSKIASVVAISALALSACSSQSGSSSGSSDGSSSAIITAYGGEPQRPLVPADTSEVYGGRVIDMLFEGLVSYDKDGKIVNELADSIKSDDSQNYTVKLKPDETFSNGEKITAKTFVDSWNYAALSTNTLQGASFFEPIEGYDQVSHTKVEGKTAEGEDNEVPDPQAQTMSGLKVVDDSTFTVKLAAPESDFPLRLGYSAFMPMPAAALKDIKAFGENPVGNGPYKLAQETGSWQHDKEIDLVKNDKYTGARAPKNGGVTFKLYTDPSPAYADLQADNLDVTDVIPSNNLATYKTDLDGRGSNNPVAANGNIIVPDYVKGFAKGEEGQLRKEAISMAIDRAEIAKVVFADTRTPAKEFTAPTLEGYDDHIPGSDVLNFDAAKAKDLWNQANAINPWPASQKFTIAYNVDGGNKEWVDAVANQLRNNLGIDAEGKGYPKFATLLDDRLNHKLDGAVRAGWQGDYPSLYNFLAPNYATDASSNYEKYSNPDFDKLLKEGSQAPTVADGAKIFNQAQEALFKDLPSIPLFYYTQPIGWSSKVSNVNTDWRGAVMYYNITKSE